MVLAAAQQRPGTPSNSQYVPEGPGWYRFRVRCRATLWDRGEFLPPEKGQVAWVNTAAKRMLAKFDVPEGEDGGIVEFTAWQRQDELLEFFYATADDRMVSFPTKMKDAETMREAHERFMKTYRGHGIAVDWFEIEGPFADPSCEADPRQQPWPSESYRRLFGDLPMQPWTEESGLRPPQPLNLPDLTANKRGLRETFQLPPDMMMVVSQQPEQDAEVLLRRFMERAYRRARRIGGATMPRVRGRCDRPKGVFPGRDAIGIQGRLVPPPISCTCRNSRAGLTATPWRRGCRICCGDRSPTKD